MNIIEVLDELGDCRPVFHSEADFQHSLGWKIRAMYPNIEVRPEVKTFYPIESRKDTKRRQQRKSLDLLVTKRNQRIAIELKYKTAEINSGKKILDEFEIPREGAQDISRYRYLADLMRLEKAAKKQSKLIGYAIFLTNDPLYWKPPSRNNVFDYDFRLDASKSPIQGTMKWDKLTSASTMKGREAPIVLQNSYPINWESYSDLDYNKNNKFQFLLFKVR